MRDHRIQTRKSRGIDLSRIERFHPYKTFLFFVLLGSTLVFMTITFLYLANLSRETPEGAIRLPKIFFLSSLVLLFSSFTLTGLRRAFQADSFRNYFLHLGLTLLFGFLFLGCQVAGWNYLFDSGYPPDSYNHYGFFYVISGIHFLHVVTGLVFLAVLLLHGYSQSRDPVKSLLFFSNTYYLTRIELGVIFWHFVDFLWVALFLVFLFTF